MLSQAKNLKGCASSTRKPVKICHRRMLGVTRDQAGILKRKMFPPELRPCSPIHYRDRAVTGLMRAMEHALLSRKWRQAGLLAIGVMKYLFQEPIPKTMSHGGDSMASYNAGVAMILEVFLHLPGADTNAKHLLESCAQVQDFSGKIRRQVIGRLLRMFLFACKGEYEHASELLQLTNKYKSYMRKMIPNGLPSALFARGILNYGMWLEVLHANKNRNSHNCDSADSNLVHFETTQLAEGSTRAAMLGRSFSMDLEKAVTETPAVDGFYKLAHYYATMGDWEAVHSTSVQCKKLFPLDADAHTLFYCMLTAHGQATDAVKDSEVSLSACGSLVSVLQCDPMCAEAAQQLGKYTRHNGRVNKNINPEIQVLVVEGLLYHLDMFPLLPRKKSQAHMTLENSKSASVNQAWENLTSALISLTKLFCERPNELRASWNSTEMLLKNRCAWWKKWMFWQSHPVIEQIGLEDEPAAKFLANVCICSDYIMGTSNLFGTNICEALEKTSWYGELKRAKRARTILAEVRTLQSRSAEAQNRQGPLFNNNCN